MQFDIIVVILIHCRLSCSAPLFIMNRLFLCCLFIYYLFVFCVDFFAILGRQVGVYSIHYGVFFCNFCQSSIWLRQFKSRILSLSDVFFFLNFGDVFEFLCLIICYVTVTTLLFYTCSVVFIYFYAAICVCNFTQSLFFPILTPSCFYDVIDQNDY